MRTKMATLLTVLGLLILAGCGTTKPSTFYLLSPHANNGVLQETGGNPAVGIGPVKLPAHLDRPEIAQRRGENQIHYASSHRWAEPLRVSFTRVLGENIGAILPTDRIAIYPWGRSVSVDYQVEVDVSRFDADASGQAVLAASWKVTRVADNTILDRKKVRYTETVSGPEYADIVAAQSRAIGKLGRALAEQIAEGNISR